MGTSHEFRAGGSTIDAKALLVDTLDISWLMIHLDAPNELICPLQEAGGKS